MLKHPSPNWKEILHCSLSEEQKEDKFKCNYDSVEQQNNRLFLLERMDGVTIYIAFLNKKLSYPWDFGVMLEIKSLHAQIHRFY